MDQPDDLAYIVFWAERFTESFRLNVQVNQTLDQLEAAIKKYRGEESDDPAIS